MNVTNNGEYIMTQLTSVIAAMEHSITEEVTLFSQYLAKQFKYDIRNAGGTMTAWIKHHDGSITIRYIPKTI
jgi:hypothetical protein